MRAVVLHAPGPPDALKLEADVADPTPGPDDAIVRVRAAAVCGRDLIDRRGGFPAMKLPTIPGHEFAGDVVRVGERAVAAGLSVGDRVVNLHRPSCRACGRCLGGQPILCERAWQSFGHTIDGGYAELVAAHHDVLVPVPKAMTYEVAATLMCTAGVALQALRARGRLELGQTVLVTGASGGVGSMGVQIARAMGARVIATTTSEGKVQALRDLGAHEVVVSPDGQFHARLQDLSDGGVDLCLELTGAATFRSALRSLRRGGRMVVIGNIDTRKIDLNLGALILYGYELYGSASCTRRDLLDVFALVERGQLRPQIDRTLPLGEAAEAHRLLEARAVVGRIVLLP